jgi:hypothetical protein
MCSLALPLLTLRTRDAHRRGGLERAAVSELRPFHGAGKLEAGRCVIAVAGKTNKPVALDRHGLYAKACADLADRLGWERKELFAHWKDLALMREYECRWPRALCEWQALNDLYACVEVRGQEPD